MRTTFDSSSPRVRHSGITQRALRLALVLILLGLGLIMLDRTGILYPVKSETQVVLRPVERTLTQTRLAVGSFVDAFLGARGLRRQVSDLERQVSALREENIRLRGLQTENNQLKIELGVRQTYDWITLDAAVVEAPSENGRRMIRID